MPDHDHDMFLSEAHGVRWSLAVIARMHAVERATHSVWRLCMRKLLCAKWGGGVRTSHSQTASLMTVMQPFTSALMLLGSHVLVAQPEEAQTLASLSHALGPPKE